MKRFAVWGALICAAIGLWTGCGSKQDATVAEVFGEKLPVSLINNYFLNLGQTFGSFDEEYAAKRAALDSLIEYKILVKGAYEAGLANDAEIEKMIRARRSNFLFDELYRMEVAERVEVSDAEVRDFYERLKVERQLSHIVVATKEQADSIILALNQGGDFESIARSISLDQSSAVRGGDIGTLTWGANIVPEFRDAAFALKNRGDLSAPVKTQFGYHIIKLIDERAAQVESFESLANTIRQILHERKAGEVEGAFVRELEQKAGVQVNPEATHMLMEALDIYYPKVLGGAARPDNFFPQLDLLKPFEQQMVLASFSGGEMTVEAYMNAIGNVNEAYRPRFDDTAALRQTIFRLRMNDILEYEADQRKVAERPEFEKRVTAFREGLMVDKFIRQIVGGKITATEDEVYQYYNEHGEEFATPLELRVLEIQVDSSAQAAAVLQRLHSGEDFAALAAQFTTREGMREKGGAIGWINERIAPQLFAGARSLDPGEFSEVIRNEAGKFSILKVEEIKQPVLSPLDKVSMQVQQKVIDIKRSSAVVDWVKQKRDGGEVIVDEDALRESIDKSAYENKG